MSATAPTETAAASRTCASTSPTSPGDGGLLGGGAGARASRRWTTAPTGSVDDVAEHTVWINRVPEPRTVKQRVHLDVLVRGGRRAAGDRGEAGGRGSRAGRLLADPEGGELCAFVRPPERLAALPAAGDRRRRGGPGAGSRRWWARPARHRSRGRATTGRSGGWSRPPDCRWSGCSSRCRSRSGSRTGSTGTCWATPPDWCSGRRTAAAAARRRSGLGRAGRPGGQRVLRLPAAVIMGFSCCATSSGRHNSRSTTVSRSLPRSGRDAHRTRITVRRIIAPRSLRRRPRRRPGDHRRRTGRRRRSSCQAAAARSPTRRWPTRSPRCMKDSRRHQGPDLGGGHRRRHGQRALRAQRQPGHRCRLPTPRSSPRPRPCTPSVPAIGSRPR